MNWISVKYNKKIKNILDSFYDVFKQPQAWLMLTMELLLKLDLELAKLGNLSYSVSRAALKS